MRRKRKKIFYVLPYLSIIYGKMEALSKNMKFFSLEIRGIKFRTIRTYYKYVLNTWQIVYCIPLDCTVKTFLVDGFSTNEGGFLGRGASGEVWHSYHPSLGSVAIKCLPLYGSGRFIAKASKKYVSWWLTPFQLALHYARNRAGSLVNRLVGWTGLINQKPPFLT